MQKIYDSQKQNLVDFVPLEAGHIGMYVCGPTVQSAPHIGHLRSALVYDIMRRWFTAQGFKVTFVRNVTDIDDKILAGAKESEQTADPEQWWALAYRVEREFTAAYDAIGILAPTYEPRATANVQQMIDIIEALISRGHAYQSMDGSADVYFDTASWPKYGELTNQSPEQMEAAPDGDPRGKRNERDFALWKTLKADEPLSASWDSPWGRGRPGWHIECSAMAKRYLGETFDIHGGGLDLRFPHHENEMAQSKAAGDEFARHWVHNGLVNTGGQKMSKSLGNSLFASELLRLTRPIVLRYFLMQAHYRSVLEYSEKSLAEAEAAFGRIESFVMRATELLGGGSAAGGSDLPEAFVEAMLDDFSVPEALAVVYNTVKKGNIALDGNDSEDVAGCLSEVLSMLEVLGLNPLSDLWAGKDDAERSKATAVLDNLVQRLVIERNEARAAKDFELSDKIRDQLQDAGIILEDRVEETGWKIR